MTTPEERFRSIRWARELLQAVQEDKLVNADVRAQAADLGARFPSDDSLRRLLAQRLARLPTNLAEPLAAVADWISCSDFTDACESTRKHLMYVRRHFPVGHEVRARAVKGERMVDKNLPDNFGLQCWLQPDA